MALDKKDIEQFGQIVDEKLNQRFRVNDKKLNQRFKESDRKLDKRFKDSNDRLNKRFRSNNETLRAQIREDTRVTVNKEAGVLRLEMNQRFDAFDKKNDEGHKAILGKIEEIKKMESEDIQAAYVDIAAIKKRLPA